MMIRASEPPMKWRRFSIWADFTLLRMLWPFVSQNIINDCKRQKKERQLFSTELMESVTSFMLSDHDTRAVQGGARSVGLGPGEVGRKSSRRRCNCSAI